MLLITIQQKIGSAISVINYFVVILFAVSICACNKPNDIVLASIDTEDTSGDDSLVQDAYPDPYTINHKGDLQVDTPEYDFLPPVDMLLINNDDQGVSDFSILDMNNLDSDLLPLDEGAPLDSSVTDMDSPDLNLPDQDLLDMDLLDMNMPDLAILDMEMPDMELSQVNISVDINDTVKEWVVPNMISANTCWITDSDLHRSRITSTEDALRTLGLGSLRFPYGHLADNYLWHTPPFDDVDSGLTPRPASLSRAPATWEWALETDGTFKDDMDFDEYITMSANLGVKTLVVVNALSWKYNGGPTYQELKTSAIEWVNYAKDNQYSVDYWQIGNEVDHHQNLMTRQEYISLYFDFAAAMKAVDPTIQIGPGILGNHDYYSDILNGDSTLVDFLSVHQYLFGQPELASYEGYRTYTGTMINNINKATQANRNANTWKPILVTESNSFGTELPSGPTNINAMIWFELALTIQSEPMVRYIYYWGTHNPWDGDPIGEAEQSATLFYGNNTPTPRARVSQAINEHLLNKLVRATSSESFVKVWASANGPRDELVLFIVNRDMSAHRAVIAVEDYTVSSVSNTWRYQADDALNSEYSIDTISSIEIDNQTVELSLPALSISVIHLLRQEND